MAGEHRRVETPNPQAAQGTCRWCLDPITHEDGRPDRRRRWHQKPWERNCLREWQMTQPGYMRQLICNRDQGVCQLCGYDQGEDLRLYDELRRGSTDPWRWSLLNDDYAPDRYERRTALGRDPRHLHPMLTPGHWGYSPPDLYGSGVRPMEVDHRVPLIDGGGHEEANLWLLCNVCHKAKTAREATARAERRRAELGRPVQLSLEAA